MSFYRVLPSSFRSSVFYIAYTYKIESVTLQPYDFVSECHLAHTARFFIGVIVLDNGRRDPIVGQRHSDIFRTEVNAYSPIFCRKQLREKIGPLFIGPKISAHESIFHIFDR